MFDPDDLYITRPQPGQLYHIFDSGNGDCALCGRWGMLFKDAKQCDPVNLDRRIAAHDDAELFFMHLETAHKELFGGPDIQINT